MNPAASLHERETTAGRSRTAVSVIVPVHGIPPGLLEACAESLERQTLREMEFVWVLDGPDAAAHGVLDGFVRRDPRHRTIQSASNQGVSSARNLGLSAARGEWFAFVDADDWVEPEMFAELLRAAERLGCPLAGCELRRSAAPAAGSEPPCRPEEAEALDFGGSGQLARAVGLLRGGSCCARLFSAGRFGHLRFDPGLRHGEDLVFLQEALALAGRLAWVPRARYVYRERGGSASRKPLPPEGYRNWLASLERRMRTARPLLEGNPAAHRILAWDTLCMVNDPRVRRAWADGERRDGWLATRRFAEALSGDFALLPADIRLVWRMEMRSMRAFYGRPRWINGWMWRRARRALARLVPSAPEKTAAAVLPLYSASPLGNLSGAPLCALDHAAFLSPPFRGTLVLAGHGALEEKAAERGIPVWCSPFLFMGLRHASPGYVLKNLGKVARSRLRYVWRLFRLLRARPGIVHIHSRALHLPWILLASRLARVPVAMTMHESWRGRGVREDWIHLAWLRLYRVPVVCLTRDMAENHPRFLETAAVIPNAVPALPPPRAPARPGGEPPSIAMVGAMTNEKGLDWCLETCRRLRSRGIPFRMRLVGRWPDESLRAETEVFLERNGLRECVEIAGETADMESVYAGTDILFLPTRRDSFPRVVMEAMARSIPVVATRVDGVPELVDDGETGILVEPGDIGGYESALARLSGDAALRDRMGAAGRERVRKDYLPAVYRRRFTAFYMSLPAVRRLARRTGVTLPAGEKDGPAW